MNNVVEGIKFLDSFQIIDCNEKNGFLQQIFSNLHPIIHFFE